MARVPLTNVDLAWLRMDSPNNLMVISGFMLLETPIKFSRFKTVVAGSLLRYERFKQRVVIPQSLTRRPYWEDDPKFDLDQHLDQVRLSPPAGQVELQNFVSQLMSVPLEYSRPLWKLYLIEQFGQGSAIVARLHHAIADGIALVQVLLTMTTDRPDAPLPVLPRRKRIPRQALQSAEDAGTSMDIERTATLAADLFGKVSEEGFKMLTDFDYARRQARLGASAALAFGRLALRWPDPPNIFKAEPHLEKRACWSAALPLEQVKLVGRSLNGTINDVLLAAVAGALRRYMLARGRSVEDLNIRSFVPVNLRPLELAGDLGNRFGLVMLSLPLGIADPLQRLRELKRRMDEIKSTPEAAVAFGILNVFGAIPEQLQDLGVQIFDMKGSAVMTNVMGPKHQLYLAGAPISAVMAWVPQSGRISLGVSIVSYNGKVFLGVATDKVLVPDPQQIIDFFHEDFQAFYELAKAQPLQPVQANNIADMLAALDRAIQSVDQVISERQAQACQAKTRSGKPCRNHPLPGEKFCRVHLPQPVQIAE